MWNKIKRILWAAFDNQLHYLSIFLYLSCLFVEYIYLNIGLAQFAFLASMSICCFVMCFGQGIKCGERNVNLLDLINDLKKALEVMKNMKELDNKEVHSSFVSADNVSCAKRYATSTLNFPPFFVANNNVKIIEIKEIDK